MTPIATAAVAAQQRYESGVARLPDRSGFATAPDGVRIAYDIYGSGDPTLVLLPSAPIIHSRQWKGQVHFLSRYYRVVTFDGRGNGRSDRPTDPAAFADDRFVADLEAVIEATGTASAVLVGSVRRRRLACHPSRRRPPRHGRSGSSHSPSACRGCRHRNRHYAAAAATFDDELPAYEGWAEDERSLLAPRLSRLGPLLLRAGDLRTALDEGRRRRGRRGRVEASVETMLAEAQARRSRWTARRWSRSAQRFGCPMLLVHGIRGHTASRSRGRIGSPS